MVIVSPLRRSVITWVIYSVIISMRIGHTSEVYIWLSNKLLCKIYIRDTLNYLNSRCNTAKLLWVVIYVVCYGWFSPDLVVINICRQRLIKVDRPLWQRSLANENAVVCRQGAMRWRLPFNKSKDILSGLNMKRTRTRYVGHHYAKRRL